MGNTTAVHSPLTPAVFHILLAISDGPLHGYAIMQAVDEAAGPALSMGPGTIYGSIQRMEDSGLVQETGTEGKRRMYGLTSVGRAALEQESARLARITDMVREKGLVPGEV